MVAQCKNRGPRQTSCSGTFLSGSTPSLPQCAHCFERERERERERGREGGREGWRQRGFEWDEKKSERTKGHTAVQFLNVWKWNQARTGFGENICFASSPFQTRIMMLIYLGILVAGCSTLPSPNKWALARQTKGSQSCIDRLPLRQRSTLWKDVLHWLAHRDLYTG